MKKVMISIQKPHTDNIFCGIKTNEWRTKPLPIGKHYVYETKFKGGIGGVIGEMYVTKNIKIDLRKDCDIQELLDKGCVSVDFLFRYVYNSIINRKNGVGQPMVVYANLIENAKRYDKPKEIGKFRKVVQIYCKTCFGQRRIGGLGGYCSPGNCLPLTRPPQSWCYAEEIE